MLPSNVVVVNCEQRSPEWFAARAGRLTSSKAKLLYVEGRKKGEESVQKRDYKVQLVCEQLTGRSAEDPDEWRGQWVARGKNLEGQARAAYEGRTGHLVWTPGFLSHTQMMAGTSLDGAVGDEATVDIQRVLELKVPKPITHLNYIREAEALGALGKADPWHALPSDYTCQVLHHLLLSGAPVVDFVSYCPDVPPALSLFILEVPRPDMTKFAHDVEQFLFQVQQERENIGRLIDRVEADARGVK